MRETRGMQSRQLHASLHAFAVEAAFALAGAVAGGEEIGFEVVEEGARGSARTLYCYEPLTGDFVERHWHVLAALASAREAELALAGLGGLDEYLDTYAQERRAGAPLLQDVLRCFTRRVFDGAGEHFELVPELFEPAFRELPHSQAPEEGELAVLALLGGIGCESGEIELGEGVLLAPLDRLDVLPPDPAWRQRGRLATVVALVPEPGQAGMAESLERLRDLQTALRLYAPGISLAPLAWIRGRRCAWRPLPIPGAGRTDGNVLIGRDQEDELRAFANLVTRRRPVQGELAWALERFELAQERGDALAGLTDNLLALRALLEPEGPRSGRLAGRIAALCAQEHERTQTTERVARAISLEQSLIAGVTVGEDAVLLAGEIESHLRALLRDVICGHLEVQLVELADSLVAQAPEEEPAPTREVRARRPRPPRVRLEEDLFASAFAEEDFCATEGEPAFLADTARR